MKNLLSIIVCALLLLGSANVYADPVPLPEGGTPIYGGAAGILQAPRVPERGLEDVQGPAPREVMEEEIRETPDVILPPEHEEGGQAINEELPATGGGRPELPEGQYQPFEGNVQQDGEDYCEGVQKISVAATIEKTALEVFEEELHNIWSSAGTISVACFDFDAPIDLEGPLEINPGVPIDVKLLGMDFRASANFSEDAEGNMGPLVRVVHNGGKLELIDLKIDGTKTGVPINSCLHIDSSEDVVVQRGSFRGCEVGVHVSGSKKIHLGAYDTQYVAADGNYIGKNLSKGLFVASDSNRVTFGFNLFDSNLNDQEFDYRTAVVLAPGANGGIPPANKMPLDPSNPDLFFLLGSQYLTMIIDNPPGRVHFYRILGDRVIFAGSCSLGADHRCRATTDIRICHEGMQVTAIYTSADLEASSEFMEPMDCDGGTVVTPSSEFVMPTPAPEAESDAVLTGSAQMVGGDVAGGGAASPKMCTLIVNARVTYTPLMWLFLSVGILGSVRIRRRK